MRVAEEVVQVAQDFLIRADQEHSEVVRPAIVDAVEGQRLLNVAPIHEAIELAVRIARDVAEDGVLRRLSSSRWIGITGKSCLIAQLSGID